nr:hypothetical protein [uncultured Flavobacterium sp.]
MKHGKFKHQIENYEFDKLQDIVIQKMFSLKENYIKGDDTYFMICDIISDLNQMNYNHKTELEK